MALTLLARQALSALAILALLLACGQQASKLNSERIRETYGSYGVEILYADADVRISSLYSGTSDRKICRTLAVVHFSQPIAPQIAAEHRRITAGGSIGQVFRDAGWSVQKTNVRIADSAPPDVGFDIAALMHTRPSATLATHTYSFDVEKNGARYSYASITEVHHPEYLTTTDLNEIYAEVAE